MDNENKVIPISKGIEEYKEAEALTPKDVLLDAIKQLESGEITATKVAVIFLDEGPGGDDYGVSTGQSFMRCSEMISLLEVAKDLTLRKMI